MGRSEERSEAVYLAERPREDERQDGSEENRTNETGGGGGGAAEKRSRDPKSQSDGHNEATSSRPISQPKKEERERERDRTKVRQIELRTIFFASPFGRGRVFTFEPERMEDPHCGLSGWFRTPATYTSGSIAYSLTYAIHNTNAGFSIAYSSDKVEDGAARHSRSPMCIDRFQEEKYNNA